MLHGTIRNDDFQRNTTLQHCFEQLQHCSNIATLCSAKNRRCKSFRVTSTKSEEEEKEALSESRRALEVAKARISRPVYFVLYRFTGFQGASIHLLINRWSQLSPLYQGQGFSAWVRNCIQAPRSACSTKIIRDSCRVFLEYIKMEHMNKVTKIQDNVNDV